MRSIRVMFQGFKDPVCKDVLHRAWVQARYVWQQRHAKRLLNGGALVEPKLTPSFEAAEHPIASVVVPFYGQIPATMDCLRSLSQTIRHLPVEVILINDASPDPAAKDFAAIPGLKYLCNAENLGFLGSSNAAAATARGKYLVFLNNDTVPLPGWLDALLGTFSQHKDVGLVGAKLVYPDGRLQEAGGLMWRDASGCNFGKFGHPDRPEYNYLRDVDYCSGACIALPRALFEELGGFDPLFAPAYYEDTDLAFRVRAKGLRTVYQPQAEVVHFEGLTSGTDLESGVKSHQVTNRLRFLERWQSTLKNHLPPGHASTLETTISRRPRMLVVDTHFPCPDFDSGSMRMYEMMLAARDAGYDVLFFSMENVFCTPERRHPLQSQGIQVLYRPWYRSPRQVLSLLGASLDVVIASRPANFEILQPLVRKFAPRAQLVYDTVDLHFVRTTREAELTGDPKIRESAERYRQQEIRCANHADVTFVVSPQEVSILEEVCPGATVKVLSNIHEPFADPPAPYAERDGLLFIGSYQHPPNLDAVKFFVREVLPLVHRVRPDIVLRVVGSHMPKEIERLAGDGVEILGYQKDVEPILARTRVMVAPLRYGAGVKGKVNLAMARGLPVVATRIAVEGMGMTNGEDVVVADGAQEMADAILKLYDDPDLWAAISAASKRTLKKHFSRDIAIETFASLLPSHMVIKRNA